MADGWRHRSDGRLEALLLKTLNLKHLPSYAAGVGTRDTVGVLRRVRTADTTENRTAAMNIIALRLNARLGRNALRYSEQEYQEGSRIWGEGAMNALRTGDIEELARHAKMVAMFMVNRVRVNIALGRGALGRFTAVKPATQKRKDREGLRPGLPPLQRTGQLPRSLFPTTRKKRR